MELTNPHFVKKAAIIGYKTLVYDQEKVYTTGGEQDLAGFNINVTNGKKLIMASICLGVTSHGNTGFIVKDKNGPVIPLRPKTGGRNPVHFTVELDVDSVENLCVKTFHMIADVEEFVKIVMRNDDSGEIRINGIRDGRDKPHNHQTISTFTVIDLE